MRSVIQKKSCGSVKIFWLDKKLLDARIKTAVKKMLKERKDIDDVVLFGSFAEGRAGVSSDVDILIIVKDSDKSFIDRQLDYRDYFGDIGLNVDIFVYTQEEAQKHNPFIEKALSTGLHFSLDRKGGGIV